jgi:hypothetical protein
MSEAPVEKVLEGHVSTPVLSSLTFVPAPFVEQKRMGSVEKKQGKYLLPV